jgi:hypothetical protein
MAGAIVRLPNGDEYTFTVYKQVNNGEWTEATNHRKDWKEVAQLVAKQFYIKTEKRAFESADIFVSGNFSNIETKKRFAEKDVQLIKAEARYKEGAKTKTIAYNLCHDAHVSPPITPPKIQRQPRTATPKSNNITSKNHNNVKKTNNRPPVHALSNIKSTSVDVCRDGRCLDASVAEQILRDRGIDNPQENDRLQLAANLRINVAKKMINNQELDNDKEFIRALNESIQPIIDQYQNNKTTDSFSFLVDSLINKLIMNQRQGQVLQSDAFKNQFFEACKLLQTDADALTKDQKKILRQFYAEYITHKDAHGNMKEYLDSAFLYVLAKITPLSKSDKPYHCAVFSDDRYVAKYPPNVPLNKFFIFVSHDDGGLHYRMLEKTDKNTSKLINQEIKKDADEMKNSELINIIYNTYN